MVGVLTGALAFTITSSPGPGLDPDSASYLSAAESLLHGNGYRIAIASWSSSDSTAPLTHFPPGYSTAIAFPAALGASALQGARIVNSIAAGVAAATIYLVIVAAVGTTFTSAAVTVAVLVLTPAIVEVHLSALSEPLFLALLALTLLAMVARPQRPILAGIAAACASLVRYAGIAATGGVVLWAFLRRDSLRGRARRALAAALPSVLLQGVWVVRSRIVGGPHGIREAGVYGGFGKTLGMGGETIVEWLVPLPYGETLPLRRTLALVLLAALGLVVAAAVRQASREGGAGSDVPAANRRTDRSLLSACAILAACYLLVISASRLFADPGIPFDNRILAPLEMLLIVALAVAITLWWRRRGIVLRVVLVIGLLAWAGLAVYADYDTVSYAMTEGADFASSAWRTSPTLAWARENAGSVPLYSNWAAAVYFHLHRPARELPESDEASAIAAFGDTLRSRHAVILAFDAPSPGIADPLVLEHALGLHELARFSDGRVLASPAEGPRKTEPR